MNYNKKILPLRLDMHTRALYRRATVKILSLFVTSVFLTLLTIPAYSQGHSQSANLLVVGDSIVRRIMPKPISDSAYVATDYTEIHFKSNKADLDLSYMENTAALKHLDRAIDSLGIENISAIEIISQSSPEGIYSRNVWLSENRSKVMVDYVKKTYPQLANKISVNIVSESWENLAQYVYQDPNLDEKTKKKVLDIIDSNVKIETKKARMKSIGKTKKVGDVYKYLLKYYYPVIRNTGIYILHMVEEITPFNKEPERPSLVEIPPFDYRDSLPEQPLLAAEPIQLPEPPRKRPFIAVKTNLVYDAFFTKGMGWAPIYNIEAELYPSETGRWSWLVEYEFPWHSIPSKHQYLQFMNLQFEARRYFKKANYHSGHYLSAYVGANYFDINLDTKTGHGYQGEGFGGGLGYGYVLPLGDKSTTRWKLEFFIKGGFYMAFYDPYDPGNPYMGKYYYDFYDDPSLFIKRNNVLRSLYPTGVGVSISYDIIHKKVKKHK